MRSFSEAMRTVKYSRSIALQEKAPDLLFVGGVIGMIGSTVLACRATLKLETLVDKGKAQIEEIKTKEHEDYSDRDKQRDTALSYLNTSLDVARLYAPAVGVGVVSVFALTKSHNILNERIAALSAAYKAVDLAFREYRARVVERYGEDVDREMRYGVDKVEVTDPETNRKKNVKRANPELPSMYAAFFDNVNSSSWSKHPESNWIFLRNKQRYVNELLIARGHVFLNEVYRELGLPNTQAGAVVGWRLEEGIGDHFIDFGLFRDDQKIIDFMSGREGAILLDFNVDPGVIFDKIDTPPPPLRWQED